MYNQFFAPNMLPAQQVIQVNGKCFNEVMPFLEELMDTLKIIQPRLYDAFMAKIR